MKFKASTLVNLYVQRILKQNSYLIHLEVSFNYKHTCYLLVEHLKSFQVTHAFGIPGNAIVPLLHVKDKNFLEMGHAIGYTIDIKFANPEQEIASLTWDGCMMMHSTEISAAVCHDFEIPFITLDQLLTKS